MTGALGLIPGGDVAIEDNRIAAVGQELDGSGARIVDATGKIVLPGFVDVHNHLWQALIRGCGTSLAVGEWLQTCVVPVGRLNVTAEEAYAVVRLSTLDLLSTGVTTVVDWSHAFSPDTLRGMYRRCSIPGCALPLSIVGASNVWRTCGRYSAT